MRSLLAALLAVLALTACGSDADDADDADDVATDSPSSAATPDVPAAPVPSGEVRTAGLATVMDDPVRDGPELCLGPVAESYPPQCGGPPLAEWDWDGIGGGMHETQGQTRWGSYALIGTWDGATFTAISAIPAALYDVAPTQEPTREPTQGGTLTLSIGLEDVAAALGDLPSALGAAVVEGRVLLDVIYDDGSLQAWADQAYGQGVVVVTSALVGVAG